MELRTLRYFLTLCETLHFGRAAEQLHISQPPLSRQIAGLEQELGVRLFDRDNRNVRLSAAGEQYFYDIKLVFAALQQAGSNAHAASLGQRGHLAVGYMFSASYSLVPQLTRSFSHAYPEVELLLREATPSEMFQALHDGSVDLIIDYPPADTAGLQVQPLYTEPLMLALCDRHALAGKKRLSAEDLRDEYWLIPSKVSSPLHYEIVHNYCELAGFQPKIRLEVSHPQTLLSLVGEGMGISMLRRSLKSAHARHVRFKALQDAPQTRTAACWHRNNFNPCIRHFIDLALKISSSVG